MSPDILPVVDQGFERGAPALGAGTADTMKYSGEVKEEEGSAGDGEEHGRSVRRESPTPSNQLLTNKHLDHLPRLNSRRPGAHVPPPSRRLTQPATTPSPNQLPPPRQRPPPLQAALGTR
ncbi:unnamed protein product [Cutaneotrichosporon oleaginosum]